MGIFDPNNPVRRLQAAWRAEAREEENEAERARLMRQSPSRGNKLTRWLGWLFIAAMVIGLAYLLLG